MKSVLGPAVGAVALALLGGAFWITGQTDRRLANIHAQLATLQYAAADSAARDVEPALALERRMPVLGQAIEADLGYARAAADYWCSDCAAIAPRHEGNGVATETDPAILSLTANAAFRASQAATDPNEVVRRLDHVVKLYAEVLKAPAAGCVAGPRVCESWARDAAYNYEYAIRARAAAAKAKPGTSPRNAAAPAALKAMDDAIADLPSGPTLHGMPGGPPPTVDMNQFKVLIPRRDEERKDAPDAGKGGAKVRKG